LTALKRRPALVVSVEGYQTRTGDAIIAQITSKVNSPPRPGDHRLKRWRDAGLPLPSLVRAKLATVHTSLFVKTVGQLPEDEMSRVDAKMTSVLGLGR
jgi:mRNA interferase MazF